MGWQDNGFQSNGYTTRGGYGGGAGGFGGPDYSAGSPYVNPGGNYGQNQEWQKTPLVNDFLDPQIPHGVYQGYLSQNGLGGLGRESQYFQSRAGYRMADAGYAAAMRTNPALRFNDYLNTQFGSHGQGMNNMWNSMDPTLRGEQPSQFAGNARTIAWG